MNKCQKCDGTLPLGGQYLLVEVELEVCVRLVCCCQVVERGSLMRKRREVCDVSCGWLLLIRGRPREQVDTQGV